jgi:hypothetical protein
MRALASPAVAGLRRMGWLAFEVIRGRQRRAERVESADEDCPSNHPRGRRRVCPAVVLRRGLRLGRGPGRGRQAIPGDRRGRRPLQGRGCGRAQVPSHGMAASTCGTAAAGSTSPEIRPRAAPTTPLTTGRTVSCGRLVNLAARRLIMPSCPTPARGGHAEPRPDGQSTSARGVLGRAAHETLSLAARPRHGRAPRCLRDPLLAPRARHRPRLRGVEHA